MKLSSTAATPHASSAPLRRATEARSDARLAAPAPKNKPPDKTPSAPRSAPTTREAVIERKPRRERESERGGERDSDEGAPKKRVRLKPESPEQLLERLRNPQLSLHEASILLRVSRATVRRYADSGRIGCQRTPGGQRRFFLRDIENFYRQLKLKR